MTDLLPLIFTIVRVVLIVVILLIVVEGAGLPRIVRRCDAGAKEKWKTAILSLKAAKRELKDAKKAREGDAVVESHRLAITQKRDNARTACEDFGKAVDRQVNAVQDWRRKPLDEAKSNIKKFFWKVYKETRARIVSPSVMSVAGLVLVSVLALIEVRYYEFFGFNVLPYLPDYSAPAVAVNFFQVLLLLGLLPLIFATFAVIVPPWTGLLLIRVVYGVRALAAKGIARVFLAVCNRWTPCGYYLALPLLDEASVDSAPKSGDDDDRGPRRLVKPVISFVGRHGSKLILKDGTDLRPSLTSVSRFIVGILFLVVCYIAIEFEPRYRFHAICGEPKGSRNIRNIRVVLHPPLPGGDSFTRIGSIGENIFIAPESCGHRSQTAGEEADQPEIEQEPPRGTDTDGAGNGEGGDGDEGRTPPKGLQSVADQIQGRLQFLGFSGFSNPTNRGSIRSTIDVTVVPLSRVLCMHEVRNDQPNRPAACRPRPNGAGLRILVRETTDNSWTIVLPPGVRVDDEWRLKEEIARRLCDGGATEISEPILFERAEATPADAPAATNLIRAFVNKPELQGVKLHVLGFASGDGSSQYNRDLALRRAEAVDAIVRKEDARDGSRPPRVISWGEAHLTNGVANSRSVRIVGCRSDAGDSADSSGQQARAVPTSET